MAIGVRFLPSILSCLFAGKFRKKTDPTGKYIKKYLPELRGVPPKYIYEPWELPDEYLIDYPKPIVDHDKAKEKNIKLIKKNYK